MSLEAGQPALKAALRNLVDNNDPDKDVDQAIDEFIDLLQTWISGASITVTNVTGVTTGAGVSGPGTGTIS